MFDTVRESSQSTLIRSEGIDNDMCAWQLLSSEFQLEDGLCKSRLYALEDIIRDWNWIFSTLQAGLFRDGTHASVSPV